ncbi:MAG: dienelactone hydrolase family protein [Cyclobacteriaceae bacterium]|nr:dienelactone hydrolase family protein [Cyclobacteriaceae bacterium]
MIKFIYLLSLLLIPTSIVSQPSIGDEGYEVIREAYSYDNTLALNVTIQEEEEFVTYSRTELHFTGVSEKVGAYLAIPKSGEGPFPVVLLIDGMGGSKERWFRANNWPNGLETVEALVRKGFAVFTIDAVMHGERVDTTGVFPQPQSLRKENLMYTVQDMIKQTVQDYMRGLDYLETRNDIDAKTTGVYGLSMGGAVTFILTGLDERIKAAATGVPVVYGNEYSLVNAYNFTPRIQNKPFLMIIGELDAYYTPKIAKQLFSSIGGDQNHFIVFNGGHKIPTTYIPTIADWFENNLAAE